MQFAKWKSIPRLSKEAMVITEKIDGSNGCIIIEPWREDANYDSNYVLTITLNGEKYFFAVQSRNRFITPVDDNAGFARWAVKNAEGLIETLGYGKHYGEWWGSGIQRNYGLSEKRFSLFNAPRWHEAISYLFATTPVAELRTVPLLYTGRFDLDKLTAARETVSKGSVASPTFKGSAEGVVVYLREADVSYKILLENDDIHKWQVTE
jgi:hypothetical protein